LCRGLKEWKTTLVAGEGGAGECDMFGVRKVSRVKRNPCGKVLIRGLLRQLASVREKGTVKKGNLMAAGDRYQSKNFDNL